MVSPLPQKDGVFLKIKGPHWVSGFLFYSQLQLKFKLLETSFVTHPKSGPCQRGSAMVAELKIYCPRPSPLPQYHSKKYWIYLT